MLLLVFSVWGSWRALSIFTGGVLFVRKKGCLTGFASGFPTKEHTRKQIINCSSSCVGRPFQTPRVFLGKHSFLSKYLLSPKPNTFAFFKDKKVCVWFFFQNRHSCTHWWSFLDDERSENSFSLFGKREKNFLVRLPFGCKLLLWVCGLLDSNTLAETEELTTSKRGENLPAPALTNPSGTPPPLSTLSVHTVFTRVLYWASPLTVGSKGEKPLHVKTTNEILLSKFELKGLVQL